MPTLAVGMSETRKNYNVPTASMGMASDLPQHAHGKRGHGTIPVFPRIFE
jgi:hypothetical protein